MFEHQFLPVVLIFTCFPRTRYIFQKHFCCHNWWNSTQQMKIKIASESWCSNVHAVLVQDKWYVVSNESWSYAFSNCNNKYITKIQWKTVHVSWSSCIIQPYKWNRSWLIKSKTCLLISVFRLICCYFISFEKFLHIKNCLKAIESH